MTSTVFPPSRGVKRWRQNHFFPPPLFLKPSSWVAENEDQWEETRGGTGKPWSSDGLQELRGGGDWVGGWGGRQGSGRYKQAFQAVMELSWLPGNAEFWGLGWGAGVAGIDMYIVHLGNNRKTSFYSIVSTVVSRSLGDDGLWVSSLNCTCLWIRTHLNKVREWIWRKLCLQTQGKCQICSLFILLFEVFLKW